MLQRMSMNSNLNALDNQIRGQLNRHQERAVEKLQNNALQIEQQAMTRRQGQLGSLVNTFA